MAVEDHKPESSQVERFRQLVRELGCDEDEEAFKAKLRKIAKPTKLPEGTERKR